MKQFAVAQITALCDHDVRIVIAEDSIAALKMHPDLRKEKNFVDTNFANIEDAKTAADFVQIGFSYFVVEIGLSFFQVRVVSEALGLHCRTRLIAADEAQAKEMAKKEFGTIVENFMSRGQKEPYVLPEHVRQRFLCEVLSPQQPAILALEWDKIGNKLSGER